MGQKRLPDLAMLVGADVPRRTKGSVVSDSRAKFPLWYQESSSPNKRRYKVKVAHSLRRCGDSYVGSDQKVAAPGFDDTGVMESSECVSERGLVSTRLTLVACRRTRTPRVVDRIPSNLGTRNISTIIGRFVVIILIESSRFWNTDFVVEI